MAAALACLPVLVAAAQVLAVSSQDAFDMHVALRDPKEHGCAYAAVSTEQRRSGALHTLGGWLGSHCGGLVVLSLVVESGLRKFAMAKSAFGPEVRSANEPISTSSKTCPRRVSGVLALSRLLLSTTLAPCKHQQQRNDSQEAAQESSVVWPASQCPAEGAHDGGAISKYYPYPSSTTEGACSSFEEWRLAGRCSPFSSN